MSFIPALLEFGEAVVTGAEGSIGGAVGDFFGVGELVESAEATVSGLGGLESVGREVVGGLESAATRSAAAVENTFARIGQGIESAAGHGARALEGGAARLGRGVRALDAAVEPLEESIQQVQRAAERARRGVDAAGRLMSGDLSAGNVRELENIVEESGFSNTVNRARALHTYVEENLMSQNPLIRKAQTGLLTFGAGKLVDLAADKGAKLLKTVGQGAKEAARFAERATNAVFSGREPIITHAIGALNPRGKKRTRHFIDFTSDTMGLHKRKAARSAKAKTNPLFEGDHHALPAHHSLLGHINERTNTTSNPFTNDLHARAVSILDH
jgi:hypothetical protein